MHNTEYNRTQVVKYLAITFIASYAVEFGVGALYDRGNPVAGQLLMVGLMFIPAIAVLLSAGPSALKDLGWNPQVPKNIRSILIAWLSPAILTAAGAILYFLIFRSHFDASGQFIVQSAGEETLQQLEAAGISYPVYIAISVAQALTYAPFINAIPALGEEIGWRGFLYPQLRAKYGRTAGRILGGVIWGAFHWPLIWLIGYEYGTDYIGFPVTGILLFCVCTIGLGILCDWLCERSGSIWLPSLFHGAFNAAAGVPLLLCRPDIGSARLLGPAPNGLIAGLPLILFAAAVMLRDDKRGDK